MQGVVRMKKPIRPEQVLSIFKENPNLSREELEKKIREEYILTSDVKEISRKYRVELSKTFVPEFYKGSIEKRSKIKEIDSILSVSDIHIPDNNPHYINLLYQRLADRHFKKVILAGDIFDFKEISTHPKHLHDNPDVQTTIYCANEFLRSIRILQPDAEIMFIMGNHELRWVKYLYHNLSELCKLKDSEGSEVLSFKKLFSLDKYNVKFYGCDVDSMSNDPKPIYPYDSGNNICIYDHYSTSSPTGGSHIDCRKVNGVSFSGGHTHKADIYYRRNAYSGKIGTSIQRGHGQRLDIKYGRPDNWIYGWDERVEYSNGAYNHQLVICHEIEGGLHATIDGKVFVSV